MTTSFENPPLLEIVAELRWIPAGVKQSESDKNGFEIGPSFLTASRSSDVAMNFATLAGAHGYQRVESLMPQGMPALPFQLMYRYRHTASPASPALYQIGHGIFTANITPPYKSWDSFRPIVAQGIEMLLAAHGKEFPGMFVASSLRYIDLFTSRFTEGRTTRQFLHDILGVTIGLPPAFTRNLANEQQVRPHLQLSIPLTSGQEMSISLSEGSGGGQEGIVMDTTVTTSTPLEPDIAVVMKAMDSAHSVIHESFMLATEKLHQRMRPVTEARA